MLTATEVAELRMKVVAAGDRAKASGKSVGIVSHVGGPLDGLTIALEEPTPAGRFYGWCVTTTAGLVQALYSPGERQGVWRFAKYATQSGGKGYPIRPTS